MTNLNPKRYLERLESGLVPIAAAQPLVCSTCRSGANPGYERCYRCEDEGIVEVLPISMSIDKVKLSTTVFAITKTGTRSRRRSSHYNSRRCFISS